MCTYKHTCLIMHTLVQTYAHPPVKTHCHAHTRAEKQRWSVCDGKYFMAVSPESDPFPSQRQCPSPTAPGLPSASDG